MVCVVFGLYTLFWSWHRGHRSLEIWTTSIDWAQLSRFYLKAETESSFRNVVVLKNKQDSVFK
jgi:hypothetical protein